MPKLCFTIWLAVLAALNTSPAQTLATETVLHSFGTAPPDGGQPNALLLDSSSNLYGTAATGGTSAWGVIFKLDVSGRQTLLYSFTGALDGGWPSGGLTADSAGNFYGVTQFGGAYGQGAIYRFDTSAHLTVLYSFTGNADGRNPAGTLVLDAAGNLYGTTTHGGDPNGGYGYGVVFKLDPAGHLTNLYNFSGGSDGANPNPGIVSDSSGNLYGTTYGGGTQGYGVIFKVPPGGGEEVLYRFSLSEGCNPRSGVTRGAAGELYGTTSVGGVFEWYGVIYKLDTDKTYSILHNFNSQSSQRSPWAGVVLDPAGNLFGATSREIYQLAANGRYTPIHAFGDQQVYTAPIRDSAGNLYGSTYSTTTANGGLIYKIDASNRYSALYAFPNPRPDDGDGPIGGVTGDPAGNLYGTTFTGGTVGGGTVYKLDPGGHETPLHSFGGGADGANPWAGVTRDTAGNLYGTAALGGSSNAGVVYKIDFAGNYSVLYSFTNGPDGGQPYSAVSVDAAGNIYGTTSQGGAYNAGVVFKLDPAGHESALYSFTGGSDGGDPFDGPVILDPAGNLYGTTSLGGAANVGVIFNLDTTGNETVMHSFTGGSDGAYPVALVRDSAGNLYGAAGAGGTGGAGVVFRLDAASNYSVLYSFTGGADGGSPLAGVIRDPAGNLYGTTSAGGAANLGTVFELDPTGNETVLYSFTGGADGGFPRAAVIRNSSGNLFGTAWQGGLRGGGVAFAIKLP
ncbi:MAG TPA: choice-of-anchor tandem repeat GloVer-containing protein [Bryobacteraceae bacterium]|nr:choice-of-anchor tandem repeat GloVer-containing protein [Bryobacteraceae bacterium]